MLGALDLGLVVVLSTTGGATVLGRVAVLAGIVVGRYSESEMSYGQ